MKAKTPGAIAQQKFREKRADELDTLRNRNAELSRENELLRNEISVLRNGAPGKDAGARIGASASPDLTNVNYKERTTSSPNMSSSSTVKAIFDYWRERCDHPRALLDSKRSTAVAARLRDGFTEQDLRLAVDGAAKAAFVNDAGHRFDDLELICRNASKVDSFMVRATATPHLRVVAAKESPSDLLRAIWSDDEPFEGAAS